MAEFYRLCYYKKWPLQRKNKLRGVVLHTVLTEAETERNKAKEGIQSAIAKTFNDIYGKDVGDLHSWQKLCRTLRLDPVPKNLSACRLVSKFLLYFSTLPVLKNTSPLIARQQDLREYL